MGVPTDLLTSDNTTDGGIAHATAIATIVRTTNSNFRLVTQIERIYAFNTPTPEVDAAREAPLIGH